MENALITIEQSPWLLDDSDLLIIELEEAMAAADKDPTIPWYKVYLVGRSIRTTFSFLRLMDGRTDELQLKRVVRAMARSVEYLPRDEHRRELRERIWGDVTSLIAEVRKNNRILLEEDEGIYMEQGCV